MHVWAVTATATTTLPPPATTTETTTTKKLPSLGGGPFTWDVVVVCKNHVNSPHLLTKSKYMIWIVIRNSQLIGFFIFHLLVGWLVMQHARRTRIFSCGHFSLKLTVDYSGHLRQTCGRTDRGGSMSSELFPFGHAALD